MSGQHDWIFTREQLAGSPSRHDGISAAEERLYRKATCVFIDELGVLLKM